MNHVGTIQLETERLILRQLVISDAEAVHRNLETDERVTKYLRWQPVKPEELNITESLIDSWIAQYNNTSHYHWAIIIKEINEPVGMISAVGINDKTETVHIGYCIGYKWWNKGYMSEALEKVIEFFFEKVGAGRIESMHDPENIGSGRVMQKCGMKYEGTLRRADYSNRGIVDACVYSILPDEWREKCAINK